MFRTPDWINAPCHFAEVSAFHASEDLVKVKQPVLVICGTEDSDNGSAEELSKVFQNASMPASPATTVLHWERKSFPEVMKFLK
jgi:hypothetical protein